MPRLEIVVKRGCFGCEEARRMWQAIAQHPEIDAELVEVGAGRTLPEAVVAVPTYLLDGKVVSLGNPEPRALLVRLATVVFSGRAPLLVASGTLAGNLLLCLILLVFGGVCLTIGTLQLDVPMNRLYLEVAGGGALAGAAGLVGWALWQVWHPLVLSQEGLRLGRTRIRWADVTAVAEQTGREQGLEVRTRDGRRLRIASRRLDSATYEQLRRWLLALAAPAGRPGPGSGRPL